MFNLIAHREERQPAVAKQIHGFAIGDHPKREEILGIARTVQFQALELAPVLVELAQRILEKARFFIIHVVENKERTVIGGTEAFDLHAVISAQNLPVAAVHVVGANEMGFLKAHGVHI